MPSRGCRESVSSAWLAVAPMATVAPSYPRAHRKAQRVAARLRRNTKAGLTRVQAEGVWLYSAEGTSPRGWQEFVREASCCVRAEATRS
jgi:hypothetical protein